MKNILTILLLLLVSCAQQGPVRLFPASLSYGENVEPLFWPEQFEFNIYREWNWMQVIGYGLKTSKKSSVEGLLQSVENDEFVHCKGERLFMDSASGVSFECLDTLYSELSSSTQYTLPEYIFEYYTKRKFALHIEGSYARYFYSGDSLLIENGNDYSHHRVYNTSIGVFNAAGVYEEKFNTDKDSVYEFILSLNEPVVTIRFKSDERMLSGKKPFDISEKNLPLESKKFKALKQR